MSDFYFVDTNIIIRLLTGDDPVQSHTLSDVIRKRKLRMFVPSIVLIETYWVLKSVYKYPKERIVHALVAFMNADEVVLEEPELLSRTLEMFATVNVGFIDVYLAMKANQYQLPVVTWNTKDFKRLEVEFFSPDQLE